MDLSTVVYGPVESALLLYLVPAGGWGVATLRETDRRQDGQAGVRGAIVSAKTILDATTGGGHMWHDDAKDIERAVYADRRQLEGLDLQPNWECSPGVLCDTRHLPFQDDTFHLIAYDPPHRVTDGGMKALSGVIEQKYGALRAETWQSDLSQSFEELWRVLKPNGTLTFKWADEHKSHDDVLDALPVSPLYGVTTSQRRATTKWWVFNKP